MTIHVLPRWSKPDMPSYDVTTRGARFRALSPMVLGPVPLYWGHQSRNVENAWQYSKVYPGYEDDTAYWPWATAGWSSGFANRYPLGKGSRPLYSRWMDERLGYIDARKRLYVPLYSWAVRSYAPATLADLALEAQAGDVALLDFDAYDHHALGYSWDDVLNDPARKMGHAFVLAMMLEGVR